MFTIRIFRKWLLIVFSIVITLCSCSKKEVKTMDVGGLPTSSIQNVADLKENYVRVLNGVWNETGRDVTDGIEEEYSWGKAKSNQNCVIIDFSTARPFIIAPGERLFVSNVDFTKANQNELLFSMVRSNGKVRGKLSIRIRGERAILFSEIEGSFLWSLNCTSSYYKISGPGISE